MDIRSEKNVKRAENPARDMVSVKVLLMGELKRWAGKREVEMELPEGSTLRILAEKLGVVCGETFANHALTKKGCFQPHVAVFVDGVHMGQRDSARAIFRGARVELILLPSYEGG